MRCLNIFNISGFSEMDEIGSSTLVTRMTSDVNQAQAGVNLVLRHFFTFAFYCIRRNGNVFYGRCQSGNGFCCCKFLILSVVVFGIMLITMPLYKKVQSYLDEILLKTRENLIGVRVLRAFNKEEKEKAEFEENNQMLTKEQKFCRKYLRAYESTDVYYRERGYYSSYLCRRGSCKYGEV